MSKQLTELVWERSRADGTALLVLLRLAHLAPEGRESATVAVEDLAESCRRSLRQVQYALKQLVTAADQGGLGEVSVERGVGPEGTSRYHLKLAELSTFHAEQDAAGCTSPDAMDSTAGVQPVAQPGCNPLHNEGAAGCTTGVQSVAVAGCNGQRPLTSEVKDLRERGESAHAHESPPPEEVFVIEDEAEESAVDAFIALGGNVAEFPDEWPIDLAGLNGQQVRQICAAANVTKIPYFPSMFRALRKRWAAVDAERAVLRDADQRAQERADEAMATLVNARRIVAAFDNIPAVAEAVQRKIRRHIVESLRAQIAGGLCSQADVELMLHDVPELNKYHTRPLLRFAEASA